MDKDIVKLGYLNPYFVSRKIVRWLLIFLLIIIVFALFDIGLYNHYSLCCPEGSVKCYNPYYKGDLFSVPSPCPFSDSLACDIEYINEGVCLGDEHKWYSKAYAPLMFLVIISFMIFNHLKHNVRRNKN